MTISIHAQIEETRREIMLRRDVYPRQVARRLMRESVANMHIGRMEAVLATLVWLRDNEADIRAYVDAKKATGT